MSDESDYAKFRGNCKQMSEAAVAADPTLTLVRGHYHCPFWGEQAHWWTVRADGSVYDPTAAQFPSKGIGEYVPFDGTVTCESCGTSVAENEAVFNGHHPYCSNGCMIRDVL